LGEATYVNYEERSIREDIEEVLDNSFYIHKECQIILESTAVDSKPSHSERPARQRFAKGVLRSLKAEQPNEGSYNTHPLGHFFPPRLS